MSRRAARAAPVSYVRKFIEVLCLSLSPSLSLSLFCLSSLSVFSLFSLCLLHGLAPRARVPRWWRRLLALAGPPQPRRVGRLASLNALRARTCLTRVGSGLRVDLLTGGSRSTGGGADRRPPIIDAGAQRTSLPRPLGARGPLRGRGCASSKDSLTRERAAWERTDVPRGD